MKRNIFVRLVLSTAVTVLCSCEREGDLQTSPPPVGKRIEFRAGNHPTKTVFSGITAGGAEFVGWESGDRIRVYCAQAAAESTANGYWDYDVTPSSESGREYMGLISSAEGGMEWGREDAHAFYAMYPVPDGPGVPEGAGMEGADVTAVIPQDQSGGSIHTDMSGKGYYADMKLAWMTAATTGRVSEGRTVTLPFSPIVTTFHVTVTNTAAYPLHLKSVRLTSTTSPLCGRYKATLAPDGSRTYTYLGAGGYAAYPDIPLSDGNSSLSAEFPGEGMAIPAGGTFTADLFALPHDISGLTLSVFSAENGRQDVAFKDGGGDWHVFAAEGKHNISNVGLPPISYELTVDKTAIAYDYTGARLSSDQDFTVTSTRSSGGVPERAAGWVTMARTGSGEDDWAPLSDVIGESAFSWLEGFPLGSDSVLPADMNRTFSRNIAAREVVSHEDRLRSRTPLGTQGSPVDLSRWDFVTQTGDAAQYSANCYIVQAPGWYMFPLAYGNAIENGANNPGSYVGKSGAGHLNNFGNYNNNSIRSAWIENDRAGLSAISCAGARIQWERYTAWDGNTGSPVTTGALYPDAYAGDAVISDIGITTGPGGRYVRFRVDPDNIKPGNALIAAVNAGGDILWSWHIWITDQTMSPSQVSNGSNTYTVLPVNLGWIDLGKGQYYPQRSATLRFDSTEKAGLHSAEMTVTQNECETVSEHGWSTYYQWGRKDPFTEGMFTVVSNDTNVGGSVRNPTVMTWDTSTYKLLWSGSLRGVYYDWIIENYNNLWDSQCTKYGIRSTVTMATNSPAAPSADIPTYKTVYDPSPRKFCVSPDLAWNAFPSGTEGPFRQGYYFNAGAGTVYFPAAGFIDHQSGELREYESQGHYWTNHATYGVQCRISYTLNFSASEINPVYYAGMHRADARSVRAVSYYNPYAGEAVTFPDADTSIDFSALSITDGQNMTAAPLSVAPFTISFSQNNGSSAPTYHVRQDGNNPDYYADAVYLYSAGSILSTRKGNSFTVSAAGSQIIRAVRLQLGEEDGASVKADSGSFDADALEWTGSASSVTFTLSNNGNVRSLTGLIIEFDIE